MINDSFKLLTEMEVIISTLMPDVDMVKLLPRLEEVTGNYSVQKKSIEGLEDDLLDNIEMFVSARKLEGASEKTLSGYRIELGLFYRYIKKPTVQTTTGDIRKYLSSNSSWMQSTVGRKLGVLKSFFGWMAQEEMILRNPTAKIKTPKRPQRLPKGLSVEELEIARESCRSLRERGLMEVMYSTGARLSEVSNMKIDDVDMQNMSINVIGKGDKERKVYLSPKGMYHLKKYLESRNDDCHYLFVTLRKPIRKVSNRSIQDEIDRIKSRMGIDKKMTPHTFRHSFATLAMQNGIELSDLQHLMGHSSPETTLIYAHVSEERKQMAYKKFHVM